MEISVTTWYKMWVYGPTLTGILGSNHVGDMEVRLLWVLRIVR
jgi:hypothetical protein